MSLLVRRIVTSYHWCTAMIVCAANITTATTSADLTVHFIDIGQGDAILIECDDYDQWALIDAGDRFKDPVAKLRSYLDSEDVETIHFLIATHPHADHIGGMQMVLQEFTVYLRL